MKSFENWKSKYKPMLKKGDLKFTKRKLSIFYAQQIEKNALLEIIDISNSVLTRSPTCLFLFCSFCSDLVISKNQTSYFCILFFLILGD